MRAAQAEDARAFGEVAARVAEEGLIATEPPVDVEERAATFRETVESDGPAALWVLEEADAIVGTIGVYATRVRGVLSLGMAILPEWRGRGGGRALLDTAIEHARAQGAHKLELEVWPENGRAIGLYARAGFAVEGVRRSHYRRRDGSLRSSVLMALLLRDGES